MKKWIVTMLVLLLPLISKASEVCETDEGTVTISSEALTMTMEKCGDTLQIYSLNDTQNHDMYQIDAADFEWEMHFSTEVGGHQPTSNVLLWRMQGWEKFDFWYQSELTEKAVSLGCIRLPEIVGSYAVYWKDKRDNEYKTGKYCHIKRPYVVDFDGNRTWCDLSISSGIIKVEIPYDVWEKGNLDYLDPTIGFDGVGATSLPPYALYVQVIPAGNGTLSTANLYATGDGGNDGFAKMALFDDLSDNTSNLVPNSTSSELGVFRAGRWDSESAGLSATITAGTKYWIGVKGSPYCYYRYDDGGLSPCRFKSGVGYDTWPPASASSDALGTWNVSYYFEYEDTGGGTVPPTVILSPLMFAD